MDKYKKEGQTEEQVMNRTLNRTEILEGGAAGMRNSSLPRVCACRRRSSAALVDFILFYLILLVPPSYCSSRDQRAQDGS